MMSKGETKIFTLDGTNLWETHNIFLQGKEPYKQTKKLFLLFKRTQRQSSLIF